MQRLGAIATIPSGSVQRGAAAKGREEVQILGESATGQTVESVVLDASSETERVGWFSKHHHIRIVDADADENLSFRMEGGHRGSCAVLVTNADEAGHQAQVRVPVGPLNAVYRYFDPASAFNRVPDYQSIDRVEVDRTGRDVEIAIHDAELDRTTTFRFGRSHFNVSNT